MLAPVGFIARPIRRRLKLHSRPAARFFRPRRNAALLAALLVLFKPLRRLRLKRRAVLRVKPRRYPVMRAPVGFVPTKKPPRPHIHRARRLTRPRMFAWLRSLLPLIPDPRFGGAVGIRRFGSAVPSRKFGGTVRWRMPQVHDFSLMDVGETVNGWIDFDQWLAPGETIASVISVAVQNYYPSGGAAYVTLTGPAQIGTVPVSEGGSGVTGAAVLQQWTGANAGTARIQITVLTSAGQTLSPWAHQPVGASC
jgi:hypothetical protein